jgi:ubiquinone/menaquinone biosynthesis C-methylase UbiE
MASRQQKFSTVPINKNMDEETLKAIAGQLRQPSGEYAIQVGEKMNEGNLNINLNTFEALNLATGDNILEIGMGNGYFVKNILSTDSSIKYTGCDFSEVMVDEARKQNKKFITSGQAEFHNTDANELPYEPEAFDKVFSINTIYFWDNPQIVFAEIWRVLKPKGQITISIRPKSIMQHYPFVKYGFTMFTKEDLIELISNNNFKVIDILEKAEPEVEINGELTKTATLLITAEK